MFHDRTWLLTLLAGLLAAACASAFTEREPEPSSETAFAEPEAELEPARGDAAGDEHEHEHDCDAEQRQRVEAILTRPADLFSGAQVFADACGESYCHGPDGVTGPGAQLPEEIPEYDDAELACVLLIGPGEMPSLASLSDEDLADAIAYVRQTFGSG